MINKTINSTWLDEVGLKLGLYRFRNESIEAFHSRCLLQARDWPQPLQDSFIRTLSRTVGLRNKPIFKIAPLKPDVWSVATPDLRVEIDNAFLRVWSDYKSKPNQPELEINLIERNEKYFLKNVYEELKKLDFLSLTLMQPSGWKNLKSRNLMYGNSDGYASSQSLQEGSVLTKLKHKYIKEINFYNTQSFNNEVNARGQIVKRGDYYIDYVNGNVHSKGVSVGKCDYEYSLFPFYIKWQPINVVPINGKSYDYISKDNLINQKGKEERLLLNSYGAKIANKILQAHSLQWGE